MGMTIDKAIEFFDGLEGHTPQAKDARDVAMDTMRKYQKIVQIMERTVDDGTSMYNTLQEIEEMIEDGNDD